MDTLQAVVVGAASLLVAGVGLLAIPLGLPGNWLIAAVGLLGPLLGLGWLPLGVLVLLAAVAEALELAVALRTTKQAGGGRSGMVGALLGGLVGGLLGTPLLPVLGSLLGAALGALAGAVLFELLFSDRAGRSYARIGTGAFLGTLFGRLGKLIVGVVQVVAWTAWLLQSPGNPLASP